MKKQKKKMQTDTVIISRYLWLMVVIFCINDTTSAPYEHKTNGGAIIRTLEHFLSNYYDRYVDMDVDIHTDSVSTTIKTAATNLREVGSENDAKALAPDEDMMLGDEPYRNENDVVRHKNNFSDDDYVRTLRNRTKDNWMQVLKDNILRLVGRSNMTSTNLNTNNNNPATYHFPASVNLSDILPDMFNSTITVNDQITEKIRSYYPSCEVPSNTDEDIWKDDNAMNLYYNFPDSNDDKRSSIATATLRLYRIPTPEGGSSSSNSGSTSSTTTTSSTTSTTTTTTSTTTKSDCENESEEDKLYRISVYWYTKSLKKRRVKRRLADSKVISDTDRWVELSVKPATKGWTRGRNYGLAVMVEDQDGNAVRADKIFKGASCTVGTSTPKPIPTIIIDAATYRTNELDRLRGDVKRNATTTESDHLSLLPSVDICTLEFPENYTREQRHLDTLKINGCNLKKMHDNTKKLIEREQLESLTMLPDFLQLRHRRHHHDDVIKQQQRHRTDTPLRIDR